MSFVGDLTEAIGALGQTLIECLPAPIVDALLTKSEPPKESELYKEFKTRIELACQVQLLKKSIEDKGILSTKDRVEVFACVCASWALTQSADEEFQKCKEPMTDESEDLLYVSSFMQKENNIKDYYVKLFEKAKSLNPNESLILTQEIKQGLLGCFSEESKRKEFYQKPFQIIEDIFKHLPNMDNFSAKSAGSMA